MGPRGSRIYRGLSRPLSFKPGLTGVGHLVQFFAAMKWLGPVAQLGARFNRTEEVEGSNPSRSTGY